MGIQSNVFSTNISAAATNKVYYYRSYATNSADASWADWTSAWMLKPIATNRWYLASVPVDYGSSASNNLNSTLGEQLATGLDGGTDRNNSDNLWFLQSGTWTRYWLSNTNVWKEATVTNDIDADLEIKPGEGFWIKRLTATPATNIVFNGRAHTNSTQMTFSTNYWSVFSWPWDSRLESANAGTTNRGWGFLSAGGTASYSWLFADNLVGDYNGSTFAIYLRDDGRWYVWGTVTPANVALEPGKAYKYYHRGSSSMQWTAPEP